MTPPDTQTRVDTLLYLYAILPQGTGAGRLFAEGLVPGVEPDQPLFGIDAEGMTAAVSAVSPNVFAEEPLNGLLQELDRLAPYALRHNDAIKALLSVAPALIPMSMGTVYLRAERVAGLLRGRAREFHGLLRDLDGRAEWSLKVYKEPSRLLKAVETRSPKLQDLRREAEQSGPGRAYLLRKQQDRLRESEAARLANEILDGILDSLKSVSSRMQVDTLPPGQAGSPVLSLKSAFLVERAEVGTFQGAVHHLQELHGAAGFRLEVSGPWPPYSFVGGIRGAA